MSTATSCENGVLTATFPAAQGQPPTRVPVTRGRAPGVMNRGPAAVPATWRVALVAFPVCLVTGLAGGVVVGEVVVRTVHALVRHVAA